MDAKTDLADLAESMPLQAVVRPIWQQTRISALVVGVNYWRRVKHYRLNVSRHLDRVMRHQRALSRPLSHAQRRRTLSKLDRAWHKFVTGYTAPAS